MYHAGRYFLTVFLLACSVLAGSAQGDRQPYAAGSFYPSSPEALRASLEKYFREAAEKPAGGEVRALIVPHAGYAYSGPVAAAAYSRLDPDARYHTIFIIGTSHTALYEGASIYATGNFLTPLGKVPVNSDLAGKLVRENRYFHEDPGVHAKEHSLEVQLPFLQAWLRHPFRIVPILIGTRNLSALRSMAESLEPYFSPENLFVISTDFSHYPPAADAERIDRSTAEAVATNDPDRFLKVFRMNDQEPVRGMATAMCGWPGVYALLTLSREEPSLRYQLVRYRNSGQIPGGDPGRSVGYWAITLEKGIETETGNTMNLSLDDKKELLGIARQSLQYYLQHHSMITIDPHKLPADLLQEGGAFVTLLRNGELRGCIGRFADSDPVYLTVEKMAVAAGTQDSRFKPVSPEELDGLEIEISVLSPLQPIQSKDEIVLGKHGIYMRKGFSTGTFLPQVATKYNWSVEEFLGRCARDKAGIGYYGWKDAELFVYEAVVFSEHELGIH